MMRLPCGNQFFHDGDNRSIEYLYDKNGNLITDYNKRISLIQYNPLNLPKLVQMENRNCVEYLYDASGVKHRTITKTARPGLLVNTMGVLTPVTSSDFIRTVVESYCGRIQYGSNSNIKKVLTDEGYLQREGSTYKYVYYIKDHLGSVRGEMGQNLWTITNYYPSGVETGDLTPSFTQKERFSGKELEDQHGINLYDFLARRYDPALMRFLSPDLLAELKHNTVK